MGLRISAIINHKVVRFEVAEAKNIKQLSMSAHVLDSLDSIYEISISKDYLIVTREDPDLRNSLVAPLIKDDRSVNNIDAYDWAGNHIWNIAELVGDIKAAFWGGSLITADTASFYLSETNKEHEYYMCNASNDFSYIINLTEKQLVQRFQTR